MELILRCQFSRRIVLVILSENELWPENGNTSTSIYAIEALVGVALAPA